MGYQHSGCAVVFKPGSRSQELVQQLYPVSDVLFLMGPAGAGKTFTATALALRDVTDARAPADRRVIAIRPNVEADRTLGYLEGSLSDKLGPFKVPIQQTIAKVCLGSPGDKLDFQALAFVRGVTWDESVVIIDEAQNLTWKQLLLLLTRLGRNGKLIFCGDPQQSDIQPTGHYPTDLEEVAERLQGLPRVAVVDMTEVESLRHPLINPMLRRLSHRGK